MYDKASRFKTPYYSTPAKVGPDTYILPDYLDQTSKSKYNNAAERCRRGAFNYS